VVRDVESERNEGRLTANGQRSMVGVVLNGVSNEPPEPAANHLEHRPVPCRRAVLLFSASLAVNVLGSGCASYGPPAASTVARGEYFSTGNADYDEFFVRLFRLQVSLGNAPEALARSRAALARRLGLTENAEIAQLRSALAQRAGELRARGFVLRAASSRDAEDGAAPKAGTHAPQDAELIHDLESAFKITSDVRAGLPGWQKELDELPPRGVALESGLETAFIGTGRGKRSDIRANLADAQKIMGIMGPRLKELDEASGELHAALTSAFSPPPPPPPPPQPEPTDPDPKPKPRAPRSQGARPAAPKPASQAESGDTGQAPRPPKQDSAKPDFEP
jgi:hypothetical protein